MNEFVINVQDTLTKILKEEINTKFINNPKLRDLLLDYVPLKLSAELPNKDIKSYDDLIVYANAFKKSFDKLAKEIEPKPQYPFNKEKYLKNDIFPRDYPPFTSSGRGVNPLDIQYRQDISDSCLVLNTSGDKSEF